MTDLTLMTSAKDPASVLPSLPSLSYRVRVLPIDATSILKLPEWTILFMDARLNVAGAKAVCRMIRTSGMQIPVILVVDQEELPLLTSEWNISDIILSSASGPEIETRIRLVSERDVRRLVSLTPAAKKPKAQHDGNLIVRGDLTIDIPGYTARLNGKQLDLAFKEFELLKFLAQHPHRVFTRAQLLQEVWGYGYYGGTRTVDVHIRRLRAKLGNEYEHAIGTVRNVGYRFDPLPKRDKSGMDEDSDDSDSSELAEQE